MRIILDARMYGLEHAGIGRYIINLIDQIEKLDRKNEYFILLKKRYYQKLKLKNKKFKKVLADYPHYSFREQLFLPLQLIKLGPDLVHFPHFNVPILWWGKQVVTIHDLIKHESRGPETTTKWQPFYWLKYLAYRFIVWLAVKRATKVIVPSQWWKKELIKKYRVQPSKLVVTYEGVGEAFRIEKLPHRRHKRLPGTQKILEKYGIRKPFIIYTGSLYPHKNVERLVEAINRFYVLKHDNRRLLLVVVCGRNVFYQRFKKKIRQMNAERLVNLVGFVPDKELVVLYTQAEAFVFPSLLEGFGLPGLEAMATGCPVLASDTPVLKEIYKEAALYFNPRDIKDMAEKIRQVVANKELRARLKKLGPEQAQKYSWQKMAKETLKAYESCFLYSNQKAQNESCSCL